MRTKNILAITVLGAFSLAACTDLLDIEQHGVTAIEDFYKTDAQVESANAETYNIFRAQPNGAGTLGLGFYGSFEWCQLSVKENLSDNSWAGGDSRNGNTDGYQVSEYSFDSENPALEKYYTLLYNLVYRANLVLDNAKEGQSSAIDQYRAEAKVFRAYAYFELTTLWGEPPLVDHVLTPDEYKVSNTSQEKLWAFMEKDLTEAISSGKLVEKTSVTDNVTWRITKQVAQTILGKVYLWQKKYSEAAKILDEVVESKKYRLMPKSEGLYGDMLHVNCNFNSESMLQFNRVPDNNTSQGWTYATNYFGPRGDMFVWTGSGTETPVGKTCYDVFETTCWGIQPPTQDLYDAFMKEEGPDGYRFHQTIRSYSDMQKEHGWRLKESAMMVGDSVFMWKTRMIKDDRMGLARNRGHNWTLMRYAEVLLLDAEAQLLGGDAGKAAEYIRLIRDRAGLAPKGTVTLDDIKIEKRLELCYEGTRTQDIWRWGDGPKLLGKKGESAPYFRVIYDKNNPDDPSKDTKIIEIVHPYASADDFGFKEGKHERLPFPKTECQANPNIKQNPGY